MSIQIVVPAVSEDFVSESLRKLTRLLCDLTGDDGSGGLGGDYGYGVNFENDVFMIHRYCWCEREDCLWCAGCNCPSTAWTYYVDGVAMSYKKYEEWQENLLGPMPHRSGYEYGTPEYNEYSRQWDERIAERNRRSNTVHTPECDYCMGKGVFEHPMFFAGRGAPNFIHKPTGARVYWYKYIGRGMEVDDADWQKIFAECFASLAASN